MSHVKFQRALFHPYLTYMANIHVTFIKKLFYIPQSAWKSKISHNRKLYDLGTDFRISEEH